MLKLRSLLRTAAYHPDGLVGTFGDEDRVARFNVDGLPRLVQTQAEGFLHNDSSTIQEQIYLASVQLHRLIFLCTAKAVTHTGYIERCFASSSETPTIDHVADMHPSR